MAADVDRHRQAGHMRGRLARWIRQGRSWPPPKPCGADAHGIDGLQQFAFERRIIRVRVGGVQRPAAAHVWPAPRICQSCRRCRRQAQWGGQGLDPASRTVSSTKSLTPCTPSAGLSMARRLMFSLPAPFGATVMRQASPGTSVTVKKAGVLSSCIFALQRVAGNAFAQVALGIAAAHAFVDRRLQVAAYMQRPAPVR